MKMCTWHLSLYGQDPQERKTLQGSCLYLVPSDVLVSELSSERAERGDRSLVNDDLVDVAATKATREKKRLLLLRFSSARMLFSFRRRWKESIVVVVLEEPKEEDEKPLVFTEEKLEIDE